MPKHVTPEMLELYKVLQKSEKFRQWKPNRLFELRDPALGAAQEKHYTPQELAEQWSVSTEFVRQIFRDEPGVLKIGGKTTRTKRGYITLRIPESIVEKVHRRLSE